MIWRSKMETSSFSFHSHWYDRCVFSAHADYGNGIYTCIIVCVWNVAIYPLCYGFISMLLYNITLRDDQMSCKLSSLWSKWEPLVRRSTCSIRRRNVCWQKRERSVYFVLWAEITVTEASHVASHCHLRCHLCTWSIRELQAIFLWDYSIEQLNSGVPNISQKMLYEGNMVLFCTL